MTETSRLVTEERLLDAGYLKRGVYMIREEGDVEVRFIYVGQDLYEFDGVKPVLPRNDAQLNFWGE